MSAVTATSSSGFLTAEEFGSLPDADCVMELVRVVVVRKPLPGARHGALCSNTVLLVGNFAEDKGLGRVLCNNAGIITERDPDTVRGPDISYFSYERLPEGPLPEGYSEQSPEIVWEVLASDDRWTDIMRKTTEYLKAGVLAVCLLDSELETAWLYFADAPPRKLTENEAMTFPGILEGFSEPLSRFFA
jgi:Uma2 family endonuclease